MANKRLLKSLKTYLIILHIIPNLFYVTMRKFITLLLCLVTLSGMAQITLPFEFPLNGTESNATTIKATKPEGSITGTVTDYKAKDGTNIGFKNDKDELLIKLPTLTGDLQLDFTYLGRGSNITSILHVEAIDGETTTSVWKGTIKDAKSVSVTAVIPSSAKSIKFWLEKREVTLASVASKSHTKQQHKKFSPSPMQAMPLTTAKRLT